MGEDRAWREYRERFAQIYDASNYSGALQSFAMNASHNLLEQPFGSATHFGCVLEVGAGTGEHLRHVRHRFHEYVVSDLDPKALDVARVKAGKVGAVGDVSFVVHQCEALPYPDNSFDRLIAVHVLEHIYRPHLVIREWARVVKPGGTLSILLPTDPGLAWRLGRHLGPRRRAIAQGIEYDYVMAREHVNPCFHLIGLLRHYFDQRNEKWWPLRVPGVDVNLFYALQAKVRKSVL